MENIKLKTIFIIISKLIVTGNYSDHTFGIGIPIAAMAMGDMVIEKYFTLDRKLSWPDHRASLELNELTPVVKL